MEVHRFRTGEYYAWVHMRVELWPGSDEDAAAWLERGDAATFLATDDSGATVGFAEAGERAYADGCDTSPVAFLEGWYVRPTHRKQGVGAALLVAVEEWAVSRGLTELASDTLLENEAGLAAHLRSGFEEVERSIKLRKPLF